MLEHLRKKRPSASLVISMTALFVALGGAGYAATGGNFILGRANTATTPSSLSAPVDANALRLTNMNTGTNATALGLSVAAGHAPFKVNSSKKVKDLNADLLDNLSSSALVRKGVTESAAVFTAGGVVDVLNTGSTNGVQGKTASSNSSGVYGENTSTGGFGVAGRAGNDGHAIYGDNTGTGFAGYFEDKVHIGGALDCTGCIGASDIAGKVDDSDKVDGASIVSNRVVSTTQGDQILALPGFGYFFVDGCDHINSRFGWNGGGTGAAYVTYGDLFNTGDTLQGAVGNFLSGTRTRHHAVIQLARNSGSSTSVASVTLTANATDCVFAAQAVVQPG